MTKRTYAVLLLIVMCLCYSSLISLNFQNDPEELHTNVKHETVSIHERSAAHSTYEAIENVTKTKLPLQLRLITSKKCKFRFKVCDTMRRPENEEITWSKNFYQHMNYFMSRHGKRTLYMAKFFFDNRYAQTTRSSYLRTFAVVESPYKNKSDNVTTGNLWDFQRQMLLRRFYGYLWYEDYPEPIMTDCWTQEAHALSRSINDHFYLDYVITCPLPDLPINPTHASLSCCYCTKSGVYIPITYPVKAKDPGKFDIALCMSALYGHLNDSFVPYFVNWMEMLQILGVSEVITNNATVYTDGKLITTIFNHYKDTKFLNLQNYPVVHPFEIVNATNETWRAVANSVSKTAASECYLTNMHRFWFILYHDIDELVVPRIHNTYAEYFRDDLFRVYPQAASKHCLAVRSAFSYSFFPEGNPEYPEYLPLLRRSRRWTEEPLTVPEQGFLGMAKSFSHVHYLVAVGNHICRETHDRFNFINGDFLQPENMLVLHYRDTCEFHERCNTEGNTSLHDPLIAKRWGGKLRKRVEHVLYKIGYFDN